MKEAQKASKSRYEREQIAWDILVLSGKLSDTNLSDLKAQALAESKKNDIDPTFQKKLTDFVNSVDELKANMEVIRTKANTAAKLATFSLFSQFDQMRAVAEMDLQLPSSSLEVGAKTVGKSEVEENQGTQEAKTAEAKAEVTSAPAKKPKKKRKLTLKKEQKPSENSKEKAEEDAKSRMEQEKQDKEKREKEKLTIQNQANEVLKTLSSKDPKNAIIVSDDGTVAWKGRVKEAKVARMENEKGQILVWGEITNDSRPVYVLDKSKTVIASGSVDANGKYVSSELYEAKIQNFPFTPNLRVVGKLKD